MEPKAAVVILNWNGEEHLRRFLPSVVATTPAYVDVIVADNGSTDGSLELLQHEFESVKVVCLDRNYGFAEGYNCALQNLDYQYFILLNSDVEPAPNWCEPLLAELESSADIAAVAPKIMCVDDRSQFEYAGGAGGFIDYFGYPFCRGRVLGALEHDCGQYDDARDLFWCSGAAFACRASVFRELGGFDGDFFAHMEEIDLCWRMQLSGYRVRVQPQSVVYHLGGGTLTVGSPRKVFLNHRNNLAMLYKCAPLRQRLVVAVVRPILDFCASLSYLLQGEWRSFFAVGHAYYDFICWHRELQRKRNEIRGSRRAESRNIFGGSIVLRYLFGIRKFSQIRRHP